MRTNLLIILFGLFCITSSLVAANKPAVYTIGDSTMADYDPSVYDNQRGWAQLFKQFLVGEIDFSNAARNGRSSKSFVTDGLWTPVLNKLKAGDYLLIQFGHNDEKENGGSGPVGTTPAEYKTYLEKFITESRSKGATPILLTPVVRCYFSGNTITNKGCHNLSTTGDELNYPLAMKEVATALNVPLIDHTSLTKALVESYGPSNAKAIIYIENDNTHLSITGATLFARLVVQELINLDILTAHLNASPDIILNPTSIDFGNCYVSTSASKSFTLSGMNLEPAAGTITIIASEGFTVGKSESDAFSSSMTLNYTSGNLANTTIIAHFDPTEAKAYAGTISVRIGEGEPKTISLTGNALSMSGGVEARVNFPLNANADAVVTGPITSLGQTHSGMYVKNYATIATWPEGVTGEKTQRNSIQSETADTWPGGEIDIVSTRYIQFAVKPQPGTTFTVDSIGFYAGPAGGNGMAYRVMISSLEDFSDAITLENRPDNVSNTMLALSYQPIFQVDEEETFYLRFYPWYKSAASLKYLCLSNLTIKGRVSAKDETGIDDPASEEAFKVFPNPSSGILYLKNVPAGDNTIASIYSQDGMLLFEKEVDKESDTIDLTSLAKGLYILCLTSGEGKEVRKVIKN